MERRLLQVLLLSCIMHLSQATKSSCTSSHDPNSEEATIHCHFAVDVNRTKTDVRVFHSRFDLDLNAHHETVFLCAWFDETPQIYTRSGYKLRGVISNTFTLEISQVSQSHAGQYVCHFIPSNTKAEKPCALNVTAITDVKVLAASSDVSSSPHYGMQGIIIIAMGGGVLIFSIVIVFWTVRNRSKLN